MTKKPEFTKKLAIVGGGITKDLAPFADTSWDIWTTASIARGLPRVTLVWEIHTDAHVKPLEHTPLNYSCPVLMQHTRADVPTSEAWTPWHLVEKHGPHFSCSMSFMLGEAFDRGYSQVVTYGVDMLESEYKYMREDFVYLVGYFRGKGMDVQISKGTAILWDADTYEYSSPDARNKWFVNRLQYMENTLQEKQKETDKAAMEAEYVRGSRDSLALFLGMTGG